MIRVSGLKPQRGGGISIISPDEAFKIDKSIIIIGNVLHKSEIYHQIIESGYPKDRVFKSLGLRSGNEYFDYFAPNEDEIFVDAGSFNGKTAVQFTEWATKGYDYIYSFEANPNSIKKCQDTFEEYKLKGELIGKGLWDKKDILYFDNKEYDSQGARLSESGTAKIETVSLDEALNGKKVTFVKMDIEGAEYNALIGSRKTITKWKPRLAICVYHKPEDILEIPALLINMDVDYKFALRQYAIDMWCTSTILYAY